MTKQRRGGLGRGLGALIPTAPEPADAEASHDGPSSPLDAIPGATNHDVNADAAPDRRPSTSHPAATGFDAVPGATFAELPIESIHANARQPRQVFDEDALAELAHSIREFGVLQPVVVRADPGSPDGSGESASADPGDSGGYELVMGERRLRAAAAAGLTVIPAIIRSTADDAMLRDALLENIHRAQLNPLEEAAAYEQLLHEFGATHDELAHRIGRSRPQVSNTIRLLNLPLAVQRRVAAGVLSAGHARALLSLDEQNEQDELAGRIVAEGLSVRATEELVALARNGGASRKAVRKTTPRITAPAATELAGKLSDIFDTRVRVEIGRRKGKITVEFATIDDLERIVAVMAPTVRGRDQPLRSGEPPAGEPSGGSSS